MWPNKRISMRPNRPAPITEECYWKLKKCPEVSEFFFFLQMLGLQLCCFNGSWSWHFLKQYTIIAMHTNWNWKYPKFIHAQTNSYLTISLFPLPINPFRYSCDDVCKPRNNSWNYVSCWRFEYDWFGWICVFQHRSIFRVSFVPQTVSFGSGWSQN